MMMMQNLVQLLHSLTFNLIILLHISNEESNKIEEETFPLSLFFFFFFFFFFWGGGGGGVGGGVGSFI